MSIRPCLMMWTGTSDPNNVERALYNSATIVYRGSTVIVTMYVGFSEYIAVLQSPYEPKKCITLQNTGSVWP